MLGFWVLEFIWNLEVWTLDFAFLDGVLLFLDATKADSPATFDNREAKEMISNPTRSILSGGVKCRSRTPFVL